MEQLILKNKLSELIGAIHSTIKEDYESPLDEYSFNTSCFVVLRINNCIKDLISVASLEPVIDFLFNITNNFYDNYIDEFFKFQDKFNRELKTNNININNFLIVVGTIQPVLVTAEQSLTELHTIVDDEHKYKVIGILIINLYFVMAIRHYQGNFKFIIPSIFKFINEYSWIITHDEENKLSEEYFYDFLSNHTPIQRHTVPKKEEALSLAKKVWELDKHKILLRKHVSEIITKLLPQHDLSTTQVDNWLKQSNIVPPEILERYKNHDYGNSAPIVRERKKLIAEILLSLTPLYCGSL